MAPVSGEGGLTALLPNVPFLNANGIIVKLV